MATPARETDPLSPPQLDAGAHEVIGVMDFSRVLTSDHRVIPLRPAALGDGSMYTFMLAWRCLQLGIAQLWIHPSWPGVLDDDVPEHLTATYGRWTIGNTYPHWRVCTCAGHYQPGGTAIVSPALDDRAPWREAKTADELLAALVQYRDACGLSYRRSPGLSGMDLIRDVHGIGRDGKRKPDAKGRPLQLDLPGTLPPVCTNAAEVPRKWMRPLSEGERRRTYLHSYDKNGMYLAACSSLALGMGEPVHTRPGDGRYEGLAHPCDARTGKRLPYPPGFWRVHINADTLPIVNGFPAPVSPPRRGESQVWITTPTLQLLYDLGVESCVTEAYLWPTHHRALEPWYKRLRDGRTRLMHAASDDTPGAALALDIVKLTYQIGSGYLGSTKWDRQGDTLYRPDWRALMIAQANAVVYRQGLECVEQGYFPWALGMDCWYFVSDEPDPVKACPPALKLGTNLGAWKVKDAAVPLAELLDTIDAAQGRYGGLQRIQETLNTLRDGRPRPVYQEEEEGASVSRDGH